MRPARGEADSVIRGRSEAGIRESAPGLDSLGPRADLRSPENHVWLFDADDHFHGVALMEPRERLERDGAVLLTLPSGERERVVGVEFAVRG